MDLSRLKAQVQAYDDKYNCIHWVYQGTLDDIRIFDPFSHTDLAGMDFLEDWQQGRLLRKMVKQYKLWLDVKQGKTFFGNCVIVLWNDMPFLAPGGNRAMFARQYPNMPCLYILQDYTGLAHNFNAPITRLVDSEFDIHDNFKTPIVNTKTRNGEKRILLDWEQFDWQEELYDEVVTMSYNPRVIEYEDRFECEVEDVVFLTFWKLPGGLVRPEFS